ncbi:type II toxin-antitoxin system PemK/MazF family toxin [Pseudarthrobacter sp. J64]|uniref:type II toxin-antitoxin system PemK/MazF family toxin n=1 Tax=Pseudarthrobacter sp. J64 TaxID=3116485 RepID=UPI002E8144F3|nr:type II toxin-antitoxin system PemK/MazF family toxin [Pseudarthrobacter sp. J64]MEE2569188.1 type II toxin-antitoxin system PemK/MazF family toxin [Pseudarthrobacter sp. J64]
MVFNVRSLARAARSVLRLLAEPRQTPDARKPARSAQGVPASGNSSVLPGTRPQPGLASPYPGDYRVKAGEQLRLRYAPSPDGNPDPGEIVWTWVPYEEDHSRGKDRPVLIIGSHGGFLLALMLTSKDHDGGRSPSRDHVDVGAGAWDRQGRPSEAKLDRILQIRESDIRREGAVLDESAFRAVATALKERHGRPAPRR